MDIAAALALTGEGYSRRRIARILGVSRNTLKKYLASGQSGIGTQGSKLAGHLDFLEQNLTQNPDARSMSLFRGLQAMGYTGSYDLVKRRVRAIKGRLQSSGTGPEPGLRASVDLGRLTLAGRVHWLFTLSLDYSGRIYAELAERVDLDSFLDWHLRAFRYFQGVPAEIAYEKSRNRIVKGFVGASGVNLPLSRFAAHHGFSPIAAGAFHPWAAGRLKRPLRMIETLFLRGYPLKSLEGANMAMLGWLLGRESGASDSSVKDRFAQEQNRLAPLPKSGMPAFQPKLQARSEVSARSRGPDFPAADSGK